MKLKREFVTYETDGTQIMVSAGGSGFSGLVRSNKTAAAIIDLLKTETDRQGVIDAMLKRFDAEESVIAKDVDMVIANLRRIGALDE